MINQKALLTVAMLVSCGTPKRMDVGDEKHVIDSDLSSYAASWDGYAEGFEFPVDNQDRVRIVINADGSGTLRVGNQDLLSPATNPDGVYPSDLAEFEFSGLRSGFEYPIQGASVSDERLRFSIDELQIMDSWCALQPLESEGWRCAVYNASPHGSERDENGNQVCYTWDNSTASGGSISSSAPWADTANRTLLNCVAVSQCQTCECDDEGCRAAVGSVRKVDAALSEEGSKLEGTLVLGERRIPLRLNRVP